MIFLVESLEETRDSYQFTLHANSMVLVRIWLLENVFFSVGESCFYLILKRERTIIFIVITS